MRFPLSLTANMAGYMVKKKISREKRFPLVMMLEPLHACNLTCTGCGRIREYESTIKQKLSVEECLASVDESGAPIISICGGEPLIYPGIGDLVKGILQRRKNIYLCTNGVFLKKKLDQFKPTSRMFFNVHLDGMRKNHDIAVEREGVFDQAIEGIIAAKAAGHLVCTNTTVYRETDMAEIDDLYAYLTKLGVDGFMLSPAYGYAAVCSTNPNGAAEIFLTRQQIMEKFNQADDLFRKYKMNTSPVYKEFLQGKRELTCAAWASPTRNVKGWKGPCYLITDAHHETFDGLMNDTDWSQYGYGKDPRCEHCMMHSGYEVAAALGVNRKISDTWKMLKWQMT
ncbi:adenosyl-hopene transferase HpnH [Limnoglobus roseus]|uniref:Hopanoid biosynthesis associated radical SAM protein HpnH n=1 Tax=Limnoglobus roseus TaxID=2598579 RepID=A0A5C1ADW5_9BACT|nr:adenosyl-hopene transferase HpnH [Limnoglobus roseus]QEL15258.1 hopanoid biosynthesis associated radical SAM protein HpnH [Limnoglobus roseus]